MLGHSSVTCVAVLAIVGRLARLVATGLDGGPICAHCMASLGRLVHCSGLGIDKVLFL